MKKIIFIGAGGHAKTIVDTIERQNQYQIAGFVEKTLDTDAFYRGYSVIGTDHDLEALYHSGISDAVVSLGYLGNTKGRNRLYDSLKKIGYKLPVIIDDTAVIAEDAVIGEGTYVGRNAVINAAAKVGRMCIVNTAAVVEHDCVVGDFSHIAVGAVLCGGVKIGNECLVGANATVLQMNEIGNNSIVGAGAVVARNIPVGVTAVGMPAKIID